MAHEDGTGPAETEGTGTGGDHGSETAAHLPPGDLGVTRFVLLLFVFKVLLFPGPDVTTDVSSIYQGWYEVLRAGSFPLTDVTWQYPPAAALAILSPPCCRSSPTPRRSSSWPS